MSATNQSELITDDKIFRRYITINYDIELIKSILGINPVRIHDVIKVFETSNSGRIKRFIPIGDLIELLEFTASKNVVITTDKLPAKYITKNIANLMIDYVLKLDTLDCRMINNIPTHLKTSDFVSKITSRYSGALKSNDEYWFTPEGEKLFAKLNNRQPLRRSSSLSSFRRSLSMRLKKT